MLRNGINHCYFGRTHGVCDNFDRLVNLLPQLLIMWLCALTIMHEFLYNKVKNLTRLGIDERTFDFVCERD